VSKALEEHLETSNEGIGRRSVGAGRDHEPLTTGDEPYEGAIVTTVLGLLVNKLDVAPEELLSQELEKTFASRR
jgi:hypothetical protein